MLGRLVGTADGRIDGLPGRPDTGRLVGTLGALVAGTALLSVGILEGVLGDTVGHCVDLGVGALIGRLVGDNEGATDALALG